MTAEPVDAKPGKRPPALTIGLVIIALLALGGFYWWWAYRNIESTDDAYTDGRSVVIAPRVAGAVVSLDVTDNQFVKKGQPLIHIDPRQYEIDREQAEGVAGDGETSIRRAAIWRGDRPQEFSRPSSSRRRRSSPTPTPIS